MLRSTPHTTDITRMAYSHWLLTACLLTMISPSLTVSNYTVDLKCAEGWILNGTYCYNFVQVTLDFYDAVDTCEKFGAALLLVRDEIEAKTISVLAKTQFSQDHYWILNGRSATEDWNDLSTISNDTKCKGYWQINEPSDTIGNVTIASNNLGRWALQSVWTNLPFVCRTPACPSVSYRCSDGMCFNPRWKCDGVFDCSDGSDEFNCSACVIHYKKSNGELNSSDESNCQWIIEGEPGEILKITFTKVQLNDTLGSIMIYTGGPTIKSSSLLKQLSGDDMAGTSLYSRNQYLIVKLDSYIALKKPHISAIWEADNQLSKGKTDTVTVSNSYQEITTPYFDSHNVPATYKKEWLLKASEGNIITLEIVNNTFDVIGPNPDLLISPVGLILYEPDTRKTIIVSNSSVLSVIAKANNKDSRRMKANVRQGCDFDTTLTLATLELKNLPRDLMCHWIIRNKLSTNFSLLLHEATFADANDKINVYSNASGTAGKLEYTANYTLTQNVSLFDLSASVMLQYISDIVQPNNQIKGVISAECPIPNARDMIIKEQNEGRQPGESYEVDITCDVGFAFKQEEYNYTQTLEAQCQAGGIWNWGSPSYTRYPECQVVYCGVPTPIVNGFITNITTTMYKGIAIYGCFPGFNMSSRNNATCGENGQWSTAPACEANNCNVIPPLQNGYFEVINGNVSNLMYGTVVQYNCNGGYDLLGSKQIVCLSEEGWSHTAPTCKKLTCSLPPVQNGYYSSFNPMKFDENVTLTCFAGYHVARTNESFSEIVCKENRSLSFYDECVDTDECLNRSLHNCTEDDMHCINIMGSFKCNCDSGYQFNGTHCFDIDECKNKSSNCGENCTNTKGSYVCSCNRPGYVLYTNNGTSGFYLPQEEDGTNPLHVYHINHTCVRNICLSRPVDPPNGKFLVTKLRYLYSDSLKIVCDFGYYLNGSPEATCNESGSWVYGGVNTPPTCQMFTCPVPDEGDHEIVRIPPNQREIKPGESLIISCRIEDENRTVINRTLFCAPVFNGTSFTLQGDNPKCPDVDCGQPVFGNISGHRSVNQNSTLYGSSFEFECVSENGFRVVGNSSLGNTTVMCQRNGQWGLDTLSCEGSSCSDPTTKGGTEQIVAKSYEVGQIVTYNCTRQGFNTKTNSTLLCQFNDGKAVWSGEAPLCEDNEKPEISCPNSISSFRLYETLHYPLPTITDNSGGACLTLVSGPPPGYTVVSRPRTIKYRAYDLNNRDHFDECEFNISMKEPSSPFIECPESALWQDLGNSISVFRVLNGSDLKNYSKDANLTFTPSSLNVSIGSVYAIRARVKGDQEILKECAFLLHAKSNVCLEAIISPQENGEIKCTGNNNSKICSAVCHDGYLYQDKSNSNNFSCTNGTWTVTSPLQPCLKLVNATLKYQAVITYRVNGELEAPHQYYSNCLDSHNSLLHGLVSNISVCGLSNFTIERNSTDISSPFTVTTTLFLSVVSSGAQNLFQKCIDQLNNSALFGPTSPTVDGIICQSPWQGEKINTISGHIYCSSNGEILNDSFCLPCGPGMFYSAGNCTKCADGYYQDMEGQTSCKQCTVARNSYLPRTSMKHCYDLCPDGFSSPSGYIKDICTQCPENTYSAENRSQCLPCPNGGSTKGISGASSQDCRDPCPVGHFSVSGFKPCLPCPKHFYSNKTGNSRCEECPDHLMTSDEGSTDLIDCKDNTKSCYTSNYCNPNGTDMSNSTYCVTQDHLHVCTCQLGYYGPKCNETCDICSSKPCYNEGKCFQDGLNITCQCKTDKNCTFYPTKHLKFSSYADRIRNISQAGCENYCRMNDSCKGYIFVASAVINCYVYDVVSPEPNEESNNAYLKNCSEKFLFGGEHCENDISYDCQEDICAKIDYCMELINSTICICPLGEGYDERCEKINKNLCERNPCHNGQCVAYGNVRYICLCYPGYTGELCDKDINECEENPNTCLYGGQCYDIVNDYNCSCKDNFSGSHCEERADLCKNNKCDVENDGGICTPDNFTLTHQCICGEHSNLNTTEKDPKCELISFCSSSPCKNGGTCQDNHGSFLCYCSNDFEGSLCQIPREEDLIQNDTSASVCNTTALQNLCANLNETNINIACLEKCTKIHQHEMQNCQCIHQELYEEDACFFLDPCLHGANCSAFNGNYTCACQQGWTGENCSMTENYCKEKNPCNATGQCYDLLDKYFCQCSAGTFGSACEQKVEICQKFTNSLCVNGICTPDGGSAFCYCGGDDDEYTGKSCELLKNFCSVDRCNGSQCKLTDTKFECDCENVNNADGTSCNEITDVCMTCPIAYSCVIYTDDNGFKRPGCLCPPNQVHVGNECLEVEKDYDLVFLEEFSKNNSWITSLRGFYLNSTSGLTVSIWVASAKKMTTSQFVLALVSSDDITQRFFSIFSDHAEFYNTSIAYGDNFKIDEDGKWHIITITWTFERDITIYVDYKRFPSNIKTSEAYPSERFVTVQLGQGFYGYISYVQIWKSTLTFTDILSLAQDKAAAPKQTDLILGWSYYSYNPWVLKSKTSSAGVDVSICTNSSINILRPGKDVCRNENFEDRTPPTLSKACLPDVLLHTDYSQHQVSSSKLGYNFTDDSGVNNEEPKLQFFSHGAYDIAVAATDALGNIGVCMTRTYITPNQCYDTVPMYFKQCLNYEGGEVTCPDGQETSVPSPNFLTCGRLKSFNLDNMYENQERVVCGASSRILITVTVSLKYSLAVSTLCQSSSGTIQSRIKQSVIVLRKTWNALCPDDNCLNVVSNGTCNGENLLAVDLVINNILDLMSSSSSNLQLTPWELLEQSIRERKLFNDSEINNVASAVLLPGTKVTDQRSCFYKAALVGNHCVECGPGSKYDNNTKSCVLCPLNEYSNQSGLMFCTRCESNKVTLQRGSSRPSDCKIKCIKGQMLNVTTETCSACPPNFFQDQEGKHYCLPCPPLHGTNGRNGSVLSTDCKAFCEPGTQLNETGICEPCPRGTYRVGNMEDLCTNCSNNLTTMSTGHDSVMACVIPICPPGQHATKLEVGWVCQPCDYGTYQPQSASLECESCGVNFTTTNNGSTNSSQCLFYCPPGYEEFPSMSMQCRPCQRGFYRSDNLTERFKNCSVCPAGFTTSGNGSTSAGDCEIRICQAGSYRNSTTNVCIKCPLDQYQEEALQDDMCKACPEKHKTKEEGTSSIDHCIFVCPPGFVNSSGNVCVPCGRGSYKDQTMTFMTACANCSVNKTTDVIGATSISFCSFAKCDAGYIISKDNSSCQPCPHDFYQPMNSPFSNITCQNCSGNYGTMAEASTSLADCKFYCEPGKGISAGMCVPCDRGYWNNGNTTLRFESCQACPVNYTTEVLDGATSSDNCSLRACPAGQKIDGDHCELCPEGFYQPEPYQKHCNMCRNGTSTSSPGTQQSNECTVECPAGQEGTENDTCINCSDDEFKPQLNYGVCYKCSGDFTSTPQNRTVCHTVFCDFGREYRNGVCVNCPLGYFKPSRNNTLCDKCPANKTTSHEASNSIKNCSVTFCEPGFYSVDNTTCLPCAVGTYKNFSGNQECVKCPDKTTTAEEASTYISDCYLKICDKGQYRNLSNECQNCEKGFYQELEGQTNCSKCDQGYTTHHVQSQSKADCYIVCPPGNYRNETSNTCSGCPKGTYQELNSTIVYCTACSENFSTRTENSTNRNDCLISCPAGYFRSTRQNCTPCPLGQYQNELDQTDCHKCSLVNGYNSTTFGTSSTNETDCFPLCASGNYLIKENRSCAKCSYGSYKSKNDDLSTECVLCNKSFTTIIMGATSVDDCKFDICKKGYHRPNSTSLNCTMCPIGTYQDRTDILAVSLCTECGGNKTTLVEGASNQDKYCIDNCPPGQQYELDSKNCTSCPIGQYKPFNAELNICLNCPTDKTTITQGSTECIDSQVSPIPVIAITMTITLDITVLSCDNAVQIEGAISSIIKTLMVNTNVRYPGLCTSDSCSNVVTSLLKSCGNSIQKRQTSYNVQMKLEIHSINSSLSSVITGSLRCSVQVLREAIYDTRPVDEVMNANRISNIFTKDVNITCPVGHQFHAKSCSCVSCDRGEFLNSTSGQCEPCTKGSYSTTPVSTRCELCPDGLTTMSDRSSGKTSCNGRCLFEPNYCGENGECQNNTDGISECSCSPQYKGNQCALRLNSDNDDNIRVVAGVSAGLGALLLLVLVIFGICIHKRRKPKAHKSFTSASDFVDNPFPQFDQPIMMENPAMTMVDPTMYGADIMEFYDNDPSVYIGKSSRTSANFDLID